MCHFRVVYFSFLGALMENYKSAFEQHVIDFVFKLRSANRMSQEDIGFILDVSQSFIARVERKESRAKYNMNHINKLADHFGISPREFFPDKPFKS
jgi:transcriptional regulator with XRE-family HTH domain